MSDISQRHGRPIGVPGQSGLSGLQRVDLLLDYENENASLADKTERLFHAKVSPEVVTQFSIMLSVFN